MRPGGPHIPAAETPSEPSGIDKSALAIGIARRHRDKAHLKFVAGEPCLVCGRKPCDPHHLRFAQSRALGRKVGDEFTVPLCRSHHRALHRSGNEALWWQTAGLDPIKAARKLWDDTRVKRDAESKRPRRRSEAVVLNPDPAAGSLAQPAPDVATAAPNPPPARDDLAAAARGKPAERAAEHRSAHRRGQAHVPAQRAAPWTYRRDRHRDSRGS